MKKPILFMTALLIGGAVAVRGEKHSFGNPFWIADYTSLDLHGAGAPINWDAFPVGKYGATGRRFVPSGTAVSVVNGKFQPADGSADTLLMMSDAREDAPTDSPSGYGLVAAGNIYEDQLPDAVNGRLPDAIRARATRFYFQALNP